MASIAFGRGKLTRQASATSRAGAGSVNGRIVSSRLSAPEAVVELHGSTVTPAPEATM